MKIAMVITSYHPIVGGAERQLAQVAALMQTAGHCVTVITRHHAGLPLMDSINGIKVRRINASGFKPLGSVRFLIGAARAIRDERPDVVHCHSLFSPALAGILGGMVTGAPVVAKPMCGGEASGIADKTLGPLRIRLYRRWLARIISISTEITSEVTALGFGPEQIAFIPNGVDSDLFRPAETPSARDRPDLPDGIRFVFAGRLAIQKRLPLLLRAFVSIAADHPTAQLLLAGAGRSAGTEASVGGEDETGISAALLNHAQVHQLGHVPDMPALLAACDAFVLPSAREGLSNALLEACAAGLPTVAARIGGTEDVIRDGENGLLFAVDDEEDLARCLARLAEDAALRHRLGAAARKRVSEAYDIKVTARALLNLYSDLTRAGQ